MQWKMPGKIYYILYGSIYIKFYKMQITYSDKNHMSDWFPGDWVGRRNYKKACRTFENSGYVPYLESCDSFTGSYIWQLIKFYILNICGLLYMS